jgi:type-F conjugative transfer system secretin TraK
MKKIIIYFVIFCKLAFATQIRDVTDGSELSFNISNRDVNRLKVSGDRIQTLQYPDDALIISSIENLGEVYFRVEKDLKEISCFVITEKGKTYKLRLIPKNISSTQIILRDIEQPSLNTELKEEGVYTFEKSDLVEMMKVMRTGGGKSNNKYKISSTSGLWFVSKEIEAKKVLIFTGETLIGLQMQLKNKTDNEIKISEKTFYKDGVRAVSMDSNILPPKSSTNLYIIINNI